MTWWDDNLLRLNAIKLTLGSEDNGAVKKGKNPVQEGKGDCPGQCVPVVWSNLLYMNGSWVQFPC